MSSMTRLAGVLSLSALLATAPTEPDCAKTPWLSPCAPFDMSADGLKALKAAKAKLDAIAGYRQTPAFDGLRAFLASADALRPASASAGVRVSAVPLADFFARSADVRAAVTDSPAWLAARNEFSLHWASLLSGGRDNSPEGRVFAALRDALTPATR